VSGVMPTPLSTCVASTWRRAGEYTGRLVCVPWDTLSEARASVESGGTAHKGPTDES
jgi:hypothetical protein